MNDDAIDRRDFFKGAAAGMIVVLMDGELSAASLVQEPPPVGPPVRFGIIGVGQWGKEIL